MHFWDPSVLHYPWLDELPGLKTSFLPRDYSALASGEADAVVFVEGNCDPAQGMDEVSFAARLSAEEPRIVGAVSFVNLIDEGGRTATLERLQRSSPVVGVRHNIQGNPAGFATAAAFVRGVQDVGRHGLPFDLCVTADQLPEVTELVRQCPDVSFVLDHCGKPAIRDNAFEPWAGHLLQLSGCDNVVCKLSGLLTEADARQSLGDVLVPYFDHALACFGPGRLLYGSDWPVVTLRGGESAWRTMVDRFTSAWSPDEQQAFYAGNAIRIYGLELP